MSFELALCVLLILVIAFLLRSKNTISEKSALLEQSLAARNAEAIAAKTSNEYLKRRISSLESEHSK